MNHIPIELTEEQRANLQTLANFLLSLPARTRKFSMTDYAVISPGVLGSPHEAKCGSVCCAMGYGPLAGIDPIGYETWGNYGDRAFGGGGAGTPLYEWCFHYRWGYVDNSPHGAASRILYMLDHGVPENFIDQQTGKDPLCYQVQP